jgi:curved DNA-binding protein
VLELKPDATPEQIKTAYHKLLKQYHPDLHNASQFDWVRAESERMSRRIALAYQVLGNATSRSRYDRELRERRRSAP